MRLPMKTYLILLCLALSACVTPGEMQRQREERTRAEWRAQNEADKEARRRASEEADAELSRLAQARQQDWIRQHQAAGGLLLTGFERSVRRREHQCSATPTANWATLSSESGRTKV